MILNVILLVCTGSRLLQRWWVMNNGVEGNSSVDRRLPGGVTTVTGVYILRCFVRWLYVNEREAAPVKKSPQQDSRTFWHRTLPEHGLPRDGFLFSRTLHDFCPGVAHAEVRCGWAGYQMRAVWRRSAASVQTSAQGLRREGPRTGLRLLHDLRAEPRPAVRRVHREMWLRDDLSASARGDETPAGSPGGSGALCERH